MFSNRHKQLADEILIQKHHLPGILLKVSLDSSQHCSGSCDRQEHGASLLIDFQKQTHQDSAFNLFPRLAGVTLLPSSSENHWQILSNNDTGGSKKDTCSTKMGTTPPCWDGASWFKICRPCSSESGYEPLSLRGLMHMVCMWINRGSSPTSLTDSSEELLPLKNHQALKSQSKNTALKSCYGADWRFMPVKFVSSLILWSSEGWSVNFCGLQFS